MRPFLWVVASLALGCGADPGEPEPGPDASVPPPDLSGPLYDPTHIVDVAIEIGAADWDALRVQTRDINEIFGGCPTGPHPDPFSYFRGTVTIDGQQIADVGVRKKGFYGSLDDTKPSLKLKFDEYVAGQRLAGLKTFTLNNAKQDPALLKQCLAYSIFNAAGIPASRCNFARVTVNSKVLGIYVNVEAVNKDFLRRNYTDPEGNLYEGALSDFRPNWTITFDAKTNEQAADRSDLEALSNALLVPDAQLLAAIDPLIDVDQFLSFWAAEVLIGHTDSYSGLANNFLVYDDPVSGRFTFIPWGVDNTFHDGTTMNSPSLAVAANGILARRLYLLPETRDRYLAKLRDHLAKVWDEPALLAEIDRMAALISPPAAEVEAVRTFVRGRRAAITTELAAGPPSWTAPLRANSKPCFEANGAQTGSFSTTFGTLQAPDVFAAGTGTLAGTVDGTTITPQRIGSTAGTDANNGHIVVQQIISVTPTSLLLVVFSLDPAAYAASPDVSAAMTGGIYSYDTSTMAFALLGMFSSGSIHFDSASMTNGGQVRGTFSTGTIRMPF